MPVAGWRVGLPTRCGMCLSEEVDARDDGSVVCRQCGAATTAYWARPKGRPSAAGPPEEAAPRPEVQALPESPPPLAPPPRPTATGPTAAVVDRSRRLLWVAALVHVFAAVISVATGGVDGAILAVGLAAQVAFAAVAALGAFRFLASPKTFAMPMVIVGVVALLFSAIVYGGVVGILGGALLIWAWWGVRPRGA